MAEISQITLPSGSTYDIKDVTARDMPSAYYGTCSTAAATAAKVVEVANGQGFTLKAGALIGVKFTNTNTASNVTLNVNSTGAKSIWYNNAAYTGSANTITGYANRLLFYMYDGTNWCLVNKGWVDDNNTYTAASATPLMDGTAAVGSSAKYAREDHVHPSDTTKVDKETGKGLSTNDYTTTEKNKLAGIAAGAEVNVQSDWNVTDTSSDAFIKNKPTIPTDTWKVYYGTCTTAAATKDKAVTVASDQNFSLRVGAIVGVKFSNTNTYSSATTSPITLNVNSTGAKNIWYNNTHSGAGNTGTSTNAYGYANRIIYYMYDGTYWVWISHSVDNNSTYTAASATPLMDGTAAAGTSTKYAREDHVHPVDTSRAAASHTHSAYVNQNAFSNVKVGSTTIAADTATDTVQLVAGNNITLTPDATNDKVTIAATDTTYTAATAAPGNVASSSSAGTSTNYARQDHTHGITLATGDSNGQVKIAGSNVSVKGWNTAATYDVETTVANDSKLPTGAAVKSFVEGKGYITTDTNTRRAFYGTCATAAATKDKVVTLSNTTGWELLPGTIVGVKFTYTNTYASATDSPITLNVNNTGAKNIWYNTTHSGAGNTGTNTTIYGSANRINYYMYDGTYWVWLSFSLSANDNTVPTAYCTTAAGTAAKTATCTNYNLLAKSYTILLISTTNTAASALTLNINSKGAKPIYINGSASSASNHTMPAGSYLVYYDGTNYYIRTDGKITGSITGDAATVNGKTVGVNVPADAKFTDTVVTKTSELTNDSNFVVDSGYVHTDNNYTTTEKNKLAGIAAGAEVNVQSDWNVTDSSSDAFIKNKPTIPTDTWKAYYGTCSTAAATAAKVVTVSSDQNFSLRVGTVIGVKFTISNTAGRVTLNVNSTGAKSIWYNNAAYTGTSTDITGYANRLNYYMYDGTYWVFMTAGNTFNANTYDRTYLSSNGYKAKSAIVAANIIVAGSDGLYFHLKTGDPFDITYPILYANSACNADATNNGGYTIIPFTVTTTQSITLTAYKAVYIKGTLSGTTFTPVSTTPLTQTVPTSNDGYQYILLGRALNSTTLMYLLSEHPIYEYSGGSFHEVARNADKVNGHTVAADVPSSAVFTDTQSDWNVTTTTSAAFIKNKPAIESTFTLSLASTAWSSTTTTVNSIPYYTATVTASSLVKEYPTIYCGSSSTLPSKDEKDAFNLINYAIADLANHTITFYAVIKPTINLTIKVIG